jgi:plastocyanin
MQEEQTVATARERQVFTVAHVSIRDFAFAPERIEIVAGETIIWTNYDPTQHTVTFEHGMAESGVLGERHTYAHTFAFPGTYAYSCRLHPRMTGTVTVAP